MPRASLFDPSGGAERRKPKYVYEVREKLIGEAIYNVVATSQSEAIKLVARGEAGDMIDSGVDHMGRGRAKRMRPVAADTPLGEWED